LVRCPPPTHSSTTDQIPISVYAISDQGGRIAGVVTGTVGAVFAVIVVIQQAYRMMPPGVVASNEKLLDDLRATRVPAFRRRANRLQALQANAAGQVAQGNVAAQAVGQQGPPPQQQQQAPVSGLPSLLRSLQALEHSIDR